MMREELKHKSPICVFIDVEDTPLQNADKSYEQNEDEKAQCDISFKYKEEMRTILDGLQNMITEKKFISKERTKSATNTKCWRYFISCHGGKV